MSGTQWIYLWGIDRFELPAIGIPVQMDNGRQNRALCLWGSATNRLERLRGGPVMERKPTKRSGIKGGRCGTMGIGPVSLSSSHVNSDSNTQKTMLHCSSGYILLCTLNIQPFGVVVAPSNAEGGKRGLVFIYFWELSTDSCTAVSQSVLKIDFLLKLEHQNWFETSVWSTIKCFISLE